MTQQGGSQPRRDMLRQGARTIALLWRAGPLQLTAMAAVTVLTALVPAATVWLTARVVQRVADAVQGDPAAERSAIFMSAMLAGVALCSHLASSAQQYLDAVLRIRTANLLGCELLEKAGRLQLRDFEDPGVYDRLQLANREAGFRPYQLFSDLVAALTNAVALLSVGWLLFAWNPWLALLILVAPLPAVASSMVFGRRGWLIETGRAQERRRATYLQYLLTNDRTFKEIRLFGLTSLLIQRYRDLVEGFLVVDRALERRQALLQALLGLVGVAATAVAFVLAVREGVRSGEVGRLAGYLGATASVSAAAQGFLVRLVQLFEHGLFLQNLFGFLDVPEVVPRSGGRSIPQRLREGIEFRGVSFTYPGADSPALRDISFAMPVGTCTALVGVNGSGKTTLVKLLSRLYEPTTGEILLDGVPLPEYDLADLRARLGVLFQDFVQYEASVRENVGFGQHQRLTDDQALWTAIDAADARHVVQGVGGTLEHQLGRWFSGGQQLSGGQWQRVALARAFLRRAAVTVLDEPTASLDAAGEAALFERLVTLAENTTTLLIAHRFSTVRVADQIVVLEDGGLLEIGDHEELMAADGRYAMLFRLQAAGYADTSSRAS